MRIYGIRCIGLDEMEIIIGKMRVVGARNQHCRAHFILCNLQ